MRDWFFYQERGKTVGPLSLTDLKARVREGRLRLFDLIYQDGDTGWKMALENPVLRPEFKSVSNDTLRSRPWVVLQKKTSVAMDYITSGPFSEREVRESIQAGRIAYSDYIWKQGFSRWERIANLEEFNPRANSQSQVGIEPPPPTDEELLKSVVQQQRRRVTVEEIPAEAAMPETVVATVTMNPEPEKKKSRAIPVKAVPDATVVVPEAVPEPPTETKTVMDAPPSEEVEKPRAKKIPWPDIGIFAAGLAVMIAIAFGIHQWWSQPTPLSEPAVADAGPPAIADPQASLADMPPPPASLPEAEEPLSLEAEAPKVQPSELVLNVTTPNGTLARIEVRTNGSKDYPVYIQVIGLPGQVSDGASFYRFLKIQPTGRADEPLDLSGLQLPTGKFIIRAETGGLTKEARFQLSTNDPQHRAAVNRMRKLHAQTIWGERLLLFRLSQQLEAQVTQAAAGKSRKGLGKGLDILATVKRPNAQGRVLFDEWWELKQILAEARINPTAQVAARARKERERLAAFSVWK